MGGGDGKGTIKEDREEGGGKWLENGNKKTKLFEYVSIWLKKCSHREGHIVMSYNAAQV